VRTTLRGVGKTFITAGTLILLFVAYQLWGTGIAEAHAQHTLKKQFQAEVAAPAVTTTPPVTTASGPTTTLAPLVAPPVGQAVAIIQIPKIGVNSAVVQGVGVSDLQKGPGHYPNSPMPGQVGNAAIAGHRTTYGAPFYDLNQLKPGDHIYITTKDSPPGRPWDYQVMSSRSVDPGDVAVLDATPDARLTLTTCTPRFSASQRLVVVSKLIGAVDPRPVALPPTPASTPAAQALGAPDVAGLSGKGTSTLPAILWALLCAAVWLAAWVIGRLWKRWPVYAVATPIFLLVLFFFFENFARFVPANV
jgi:sortase A